MGEFAQLGSHVELVHHSLVTLERPCSPRLPIPTLPAIRSRASGETGARTRGAVPVADVPLSYVLVRNPEPPSSSVAVSDPPHPVTPGQERQRGLLARTSAFTSRLALVTAAPEDRTPRRA